MKNNPSSQSFNSNSSGGNGGTTISNLSAFGAIGNNIATVFGVA